ncbi:hypothetical protein RSK20926_15111 [Roseobacter sp. SK209-2-6]|nr:hypothetical protein RSK20926_15111 [Roseobacter sp. SK209-2-6]
MSAKAAKKANLTHIFFAQICFAILRAE